MNFERIILWLCLFYSVAMTSGVIFLFFKSQQFKVMFSFRILQYFIVMMYAYGLYALWGDAFFRISVSPLLKSDKDIISISNILGLLSTPFLVIGMTMALIWTFSLVSKARIIISLLLTAALIYLSYNFIYSGSALSSVRQIYGWSTLTIFTYAASLLAISKKKYLNKKEVAPLIGGLFFAGALHFLINSPAINIIVVELPLVFLFFLTFTFIAIYFIHLAKRHVGKFSKGRSYPLSFELFVKKHGITRRESEIIIEIYEGKTNQEIADKLFVTIQTVKDHTHRIYKKTQVNNRMQLTSLLRSYQKPDSSGIPQK